MSQPSLTAKFDDELRLSTVLAVELEDAKKTLAQLKLEEPKPIHNEPLSLNVDFYVRKIITEKDNLESRQQKLETGEQPRDWNLYKNNWKLQNFFGHF